jgi:hypothetical protein
MLLQLLISLVLVKLAQIEDIMTFRTAGILLRESCLIASYEHRNNFADIFMMVP